mmetsp:Transcript_108173/g.301604  ORF Transcript_108173/g.301604 Transcript_108173/m.301604 type:complete len:397 (+) Transcript_108173:57-1247(+)|eukprot:CAMPEP_0179105432 /NCGR_PEP_ID=MMETSP0796-20121207/48965_1 /TAXON_ID=73915 /ORGANISM="Pyrodinium bahamense, Strain pbaha01" /LENGTH=396 /DNA_ID=CAMNT_0020803419 /DNA_START=56 /DNA_END=1246 /DNA_ORIENTATION=-
MSMSKGPAQQHLEKLDKIFGPEYFQHGRLVLTVARDIPGMMKIAHKLQAKVNEGFGAVVEVIMEHVKYEWWAKLHESTATVGLHKGEEVPDCQVTHIPEGIRHHPYKRDHMPTLEVLLLWEDASRTTRGHCLFSISHPDTPSLEQVDAIFAEIEPYFAKRWLLVELKLGPPVQGDLEDIDRDAAEEPGHPEHVGAGVEVTVLACHAYGFAREPAGGAAPHVSHCQPMAIKTATDDAGRATLCFLPAEVNKIQVAETDMFHGCEVVLPRADIKRPDMGPTTVSVSLTPKAVAALTVHVFILPRKLPAAEDTDGIIDWASEDREALPGASVEVTLLKDGAEARQLAHVGGGVFVPEQGGLPEGCINLVSSCPGYESEERVVMLLVGTNDIYVPLRRGV